MPNEDRLREPVQLSQIRRWEVGELYPDHDTFAFGHGFGKALVEAFDALQAVALAARDHSHPREDTGISECPICVSLHEYIPGLPERRTNGK